ncbi:MAG: hypothetical protein ACFB4J_00310 [Elainellaceae cyanobacterium]
MTSLNNLRRLLTDVLQACNFNVIYEKGDYLVAKEAPGGVNFAKLVTVEVVIGNYPHRVETEVERNLEMSFVIKNEELPLHMDNHCRRKFNLVNQAIAENQYLELVDEMA